MEENQTFESVTNGNHDDVIVGATKLIEKNDDDYNERLVVYESEPRPVHSSQATTPKQEPPNVPTNFDAEMGAESNGCCHNSPCDSWCFCNSCCCKSSHGFLDGNPNAIAFMLDSVAAAIVFVGSGAFLVTTLIKLAKYEAGCLDENDDMVECTTTVHGMKPSSLLTTYATAIGMVAALSMPLVGAIVDTTPYRRALGRIFAAAFTAALLPTIFVDESNWFSMSVAFAFVGFIGYFETMTLYAYLPELTNIEETLNRYTRTIAVGCFTGMVLYLLLIVAITLPGTIESKNKDDDSSESKVDDDIRSARIAQSVSFGVAATFFTVSWGFLFQPRPPARMRPTAGTPRQWLASLWSASFVQLYRTARTVHRHHRELQWFFVAMALSDSATNSVFLFAITFLTDVLDFSGGQNGTAMLILLLSCIPGGVLSYWCSGRVNPVASSIVAVLIMMINTALFASILRRPEQATTAYLLAIPWGIGIGWKFTVDRMLYAMILPKTQGNFAEYSGSYIFFRFSLTWLPPLVFTILNERTDIPLQWAIASLDIFFLLTLLTYVFGVKVHRYEQAVADAQRQQPNVTLAPGAPGFSAVDASDDIPENPHKTNNSNAGCLPSTSVECPTIQLGEM